MGSPALWAVTAIDGVAYGLLLFVVGAGLALIFGVMNVLNLAHGTLYLLGTYLAYLLTDGSLTVLALTVAAGIAAGAGGGVLLTGLMRPLHDHLDQALATLGVAFVATWVFTASFGAAPLPADPPTALAGSVGLAGHSYPAYRLLFIAVAALLAVALHVVLRRTTAGMVLRAVVSDPQMAAASGIRTHRVRTLALAVGGALAVGAGVLGAPLLGPTPGVDNHVLVLSLIVVVLGGAGSIPATLAAALAVGQVQTVGVIAAPSFSAFILFALVLTVLVVRGRATTHVARPA